MVPGSHGSMLSAKKIGPGGWRYYFHSVMVGDGRGPAGKPLRAAQDEAGVPTGVWKGRSLAAVGLAAGDVVTERQVELLLGEAGTAALAWYLGELSYLGMSEGQFADGLRRVRQLLTAPYVDRFRPAGPRPRCDTILSGRCRTGRRCPRCSRWRTTADAASRGRGSRA